MKYLTLEIVKCHCGFPKQAHYLIMRGEKKGAYWFPHGVPAYMVPAEELRASTSLIQALRYLWRFQQEEAKTHGS